MDKYFELKISINPEIEEIVSDICFTHFSCEGVVLAEEAYKDLEMTSTTSGTLRVFLSEINENPIEILKTERELLKSRGFTDEELGSWAVTLDEKENQDWSKKWKEKWTVTHVTDKITVVPSWIEYKPKENEIIITLDPGCAFGTGTHQTTQLCMKALEKYLKKGDSVADIGTGSGILAILAKKLGVNPVGTMAHEWIMCVGQGNHKHNPAYSNWYALDYWVKEYGILNGTALTDAITTDCFLRDFQLTYSTLFSGVRHDSGDPIEWGEKMIDHYKSLGIDPTTKTLLFSDSLDFERASNIYAHFKGKARVAFGIGTYIANDTSVPALNIVMKTTACNGQDVAKISDVEGKGMCKNPEYVDYLQRCIRWRMEHETV